VKIEIVRMDVQKQFLREFGVYQLEGRYPDAEQIMIDLHIVKTETSKAKEMLEWLKTRL